MKTCRFLACLVGLAPIPGLAGAAYGSSFAVSAEQISRLGVETEVPFVVDAMVIATGPAQVVIPPTGLAVASAPTGGMLSRIYVAAGDTVTVGQVFAELESADLLEWQRSFLEASIESELAELQLSRDSALVADGIVAGRRLEEAQARARAATARLDQARRQLEIAGLGKAEIDSLQQSGELDSRLALKAPIEGVVTERFADPGSRLAPMDPVASFADVRELAVEMHLNPESAALIEPGMRIVLPLAGFRVEAPVTVVGAVIEPDTQTVLVRGELANGERRLRAGQFFSAEVVAAAAGFRLPASALVRNGDAAYVFVREADGFRAVAVEPEHEDERYVLLGEGIEPGSAIAVRGTSTLKSLWLSNEEGEAP